MWLIILSDQLTIVALVGLYPTNKLIVRRLLSRRLAPLTLRYHAVLAVVSHGCPPPRDRFLRVTHPSATAGLLRPCDLHVLSMPPAFTLSQDQTLRFISAPAFRTSPESQSINEQTRTHGSALPTHGEWKEQSKRTVTHKEYIAAHPFDCEPTSPGSVAKNQNQPIRPANQTPARAGIPMCRSLDTGAANVSLPSLFTSQRAERRRPIPRDPRADRPTCSMSCTQTGADRRR